LHVNFKLIEERFLPEMDGMGRMYEHTSGAQILHVANSDENKVFNCSFRTPPGDDTGVPHILEHCVLNGSENFPLKDPFFTMAKGSLNTFLNAMTYPDITMYPVASYNDKDFMNLMNVYLDAVYKPLVHARENSFLQEGWHYALENPDDELTINGVVYSEMKGAYSSPDRVLDLAMERLMYPESQYRFSSGGDPASIPNLTYEQFKEFHKTLYNPANSYIYLYGDMDIAMCMSMIDEYLNGCEERRELVKAATATTPQTPHTAPIFGEAVYSINEADDPAGKNFLGAMYGTPGFPDPVKYMGFEILSYMLMSTPAAPLKNALLEKKLGESLYGYYGLPSETPNYQMVVKNSQYDVTELKSAVEEIIGGIVEQGLDKKYVEACLNILEFNYREKDTPYPKGLMALLEYGTGWTYGKNPMDYFSPVATISEIRTKVMAGEPYFENLAKELFLGNNNAAFVTLKAEPGLQQKDEIKLKEELAAVKATLTPEQIEEIIAKKKMLDAWQNTPDTPEALASIPILALSDISATAKPIIAKPCALGHANALHLDTDSNGIAYVNFLFDVRGLSERELPLVGMLNILLSKLDTRQRSYIDLTSEVAMQLGNWSTFTGSGAHKNGVDFIPQFGASAKALEKNLPGIYTLTTEILTETLFEDKDRILMLLSERKSQMESGFINNGMSYAIGRSSAYISEKAAYADLMTGYGFYEFLKAVVDKYDTVFDAFKASLDVVCKKVFAKNTVMATLACNQGMFNLSIEPMNALYAALADGVHHVTVDVTPKTINEAFIAETKVNYCAQAFDWRGQENDGVIKVLNEVINMEYLLQEIRVKGGAYGFRGAISFDGVGMLASYRDPNLERTYQVYKDLADFIEQYEPSDREMLQFVMGAINGLDAPMTVSQKLTLGTAAYFAGMNEQDVQRQRDEILAASAEQIRKLAPALRDAIAKAPICTFGSETAIQENKAMFNNVVKL